MEATTTKMKLKKGDQVAEGAVLVEIRAEAK